MLLLWGLATAASVVINEVCYDPPGSDDGAEFVELLNITSEPLALDGVRLEFANGADGPVWQVRWTGSAGDVAPPNGRFLIADSGWAGSPADALATLDLQNGPDALRLADDTGVIDLVGWGDSGHAELAERTPAPDVAAASLARRPDGADTGNNAADFVLAEPTPGQVNWPAFSPQLVSWSWRPPSLAGPGDLLTGAGRVANAGAESLAGAMAILEVGGDQASHSLPTMAPGDTLPVELSLRPSGRGGLQAALRIVGPDAAIVALPRVQVGLPEVRLGEVMAAPTAGGEWCELVNTGSVPRSLAGLSLRDEDGSWRPLPAVDLAPGACRVLVQDEAAFRSWLEHLAAAGASPGCADDDVQPLGLPGWPSLNNTAPASRAFADRLLLADADGAVLDHVTIGLGTGAAPVGRSLERGADERWRPATAAAGATPGCVPAPLPGLAGGDVSLRPNPFNPRTDGAVRIMLRVPDGRDGFAARIFDLWGRPVRDLGGDDLGPGARDLAWDGRDDARREQPAGGYVAVVWWRAGDTLVPGHRGLVVLREQP
jgi:hypothetical protein